MVLVLIYKLIQFLVLRWSSHLFWLLRLSTAARPVEVDPIDSMCCELSIGLRDIQQRLKETINFFLNCFLSLNLCRKLVI